MTTWLRVPMEALSAGERQLDEAAARYATRVHRLGIGDRFLAFDPIEGTETEATLLRAERGVLVRLEEPRAAQHVPTRRVTVIQTASKGARVDDVIRDATELGATRFVVAVGRRSVRKPESHQAARWRRIAIEAARQCGRGDVPSIEGPIPLEEALAEPADVRWLLDPRGTPLAEIAPRAAGAIAVVIGPEGGFDDEERALAHRLGYAMASLGAFVLRTETACAAALGAIAAMGVAPQRTGA